MKVPAVAIIGRPNVGKSSLFNRIMKERIAIEEPTEGVTRDRLICDSEINGRKIQLIDTGGIGVVDRQNLEEDVNEQIEFAIASADLILFLVDGRNDVTELDRKVGKKLHQVSVPSVLIANKVDNEQIEYELDRFKGLGFGEALAISVLHNRGIKELFTSLSRVLPKCSTTETQKKAPFELALAGRRNVGKSSITNRLCGHNRVIVSDMAGTTRDAIDVQIEYGGQNYTLIDTAGLRKRSQNEDSIEFFSVSRTFGALYRAQVGLLMIDAKQGISQVDQKLGRWISDNHKPCIIVVNKWDLADEAARENYENYVRKRLPGLSYAPTVYVSAKTGENIDQLFKTLDELKDELALEIATSELNNALQEAQQRKAPKRINGIQPKLFYVSRLKQTPPTFIVFGKNAQKLGDQYRRYLAEFFRQRLKMPHMPIHFVFKSRQSMYK